MLRLTSIVLASALVASAGLAQNPPDQTGPAGGQSQQQQKMSTMHEQMMKEMQADLDTMRSNLQKMKDQLGKVSDQATKDVLQTNIDMWQSVISTMDKHMNMMKQMGGEHGMMRKGRKPAPPKQ